MTHVPASSHGTTFNGGTITQPLVVQGAPGTGDDLLVVYNDVRPIVTPNSEAFAVTGDGSVYFRSGSGTIALNVVSQDGANFLNYRSGVGLGVWVGNAAVHQFLNATLGFFGHAPAAQQALTSGTATPEQIALALQASGLCGGT